MDATQKNIKKHTYKKCTLNKKFGFLRSKYNDSGTQHFPALQVHTVTSFLTTYNILCFKTQFFMLKIYVVDVRGSVHHSTICKEKSNKMQQCAKILLFHIYMKLNMFRVTHRPSSGA